MSDGLNNLKRMLNNNYLLLDEKDLQDLQVNKDYFIDYNLEDMKLQLAKLLLSLTNRNITSSVIVVPLIEDMDYFVGLSVYRDKYNMRETFKPTNGEEEPLYISRHDIIEAFNKIGYDDLNSLCSFKEVIIRFCLNLGIDPDIILKDVR